MAHLLARHAPNLETLHFYKNELTWVSLGQLRCTTKLSSCFYRHRSHVDKLMLDGLVEAVADTLQELDLCCAAVGLSVVSKHAQLCLRAEFFWLASFI